MASVEVIESDLEINPSPNIGVNSAWRYSKLLGPISEALCSSVGSQHSVCAFISCLVRWCSPPYITWLVIAVIVNSVDTVPAGWLPAYVGHKSLKTATTTPAVMHRNSPGTIVTVHGIFGIVTPLDHRDPGFVNWIPVLSVCCHRFNPQASTRGSFSHAERVKCTAKNLTTFTQALDMAVVAMPIQHFYDSGPAVFMASNVHSFRSSHLCRQAAARACVASLKVGGRNLQSPPTFTLTKPQGVPSQGASFLDCLKPTEGYASKISCGSHFVNLIGETKCQA